MVNVPYFRVRACSCWYLSLKVGHVQSLRHCAVHRCADRCRSVQVTDYMDPVPHLPPSWLLGYRHAGPEAQVCWYDLTCLACVACTTHFTHFDRCGTMQPCWSTTPPAVALVQEVHSQITIHWYCPGSFIVEHLDKFVFRQVFASDMVRSLGFLRENWSR